MRKWLRSPGLARSPASVPVTEASLGDGIFPAREFLDAGGSFGVGTDSNVLVGVADELRQLEYGQRLKHRARNVLSGGAGRSTGRTLFDHALAGGARALAQATVGLTPGARADIVTLDAAHPSLAGRARAMPSSTAGFLPQATARSIASGPAADKVVEGGRHRLRSGRTRTLQRIDAEARRMSLAIRRRRTSRRSTSASAPTSKNAS